MPVFQPSIFLILTMRLASLGWLWHLPELTPLDPREYSLYSRGAMVYPTSAHSFPWLAGGPSICSGLFYWAGVSILSSPSSSLPLPPPSPPKKYTS